MGPRLFPRDSEYGEEDPDVGVKLPDHFFVFFFLKKNVVSFHTPISNIYFFILFSNLVDLTLARYS